MFDFKRVLGFIWAGPLTLLGLTYVTLFTLLGWYQRLGPMGDVLVWQLNADKSPSWLTKAWTRWGGHCIGNVVVLKYSPDTDRGCVTLRHEQEHARQFMKLGVFMPVFYGVMWLTIKIACPRSNPYYSNPFEVEARRAACQIVDIEGTVARGVASGRLQVKDKKIVLR